MKTHYPKIFSFILLGVSALFAVPAFAADRPLPNIVFLYADDLGYGDIRVQNPDSKIPTPCIDRLASEGMRFTDAHSSSALCTPSRYAVLQGRYHWRKGQHDIVYPFGPPVLDRESVTLMQLLKSRGYRTACIGKWHLGWDWDAVKKTDARPDHNTGYSPDDFDWSRPIPDGPTTFGFDEYFGNDVPNFPPYAWFENDRLQSVPTVTLRGGAAEYFGQRFAEGPFDIWAGPATDGWDFYAVMPTLTDRAVEWIGRQKKGEPFFLYFPFTSPHTPIVPAAEFAGTSGANGYGDYVVQTDAAVGRVLAALEAAGLTEDTLVIFSSDNGPEFPAYDRIRNYDHRSMGPLRGLKRDLWEGGHRTPMIVRWPGNVPAGKECHALMSQIDLYATVAAMIGAEIPPNSAEDSRNQLPLFLGSETSARNTLIHNTVPGRYALRHGDWLFIDANSGGHTAVPAWFAEMEGFENNPFPGELYDLRTDPGQKKNLYGVYPEKAAEMKEMLETMRR